MVFPRLANPETKWLKPTQRNLFSPFWRPEVKMHMSTRFALLGVVPGLSPSSWWTLAITSIAYFIDVSPSSLPCLLLTFLSVHFCLSLDSLNGFRAHAMQYDLILILTLITSERYLFPSKVVF
jgi:hypothetical protein